MPRARAPREIQELDLPSSIRDRLGQAERDAHDARLRIRGLADRVSDLEEALKDPALGLVRVVALEAEVDRLVHLLQTNFNLSFRRRTVRQTAKEESNEQ
jgi:hypothetical protein